MAGSTSRRGLWQRAFCWRRTEKVGGRCMSGWSRHRRESGKKGAGAHQMAKTAFIGLGVMGFPMAGHLAAQGHEVTVFNRTAARAEAWTAKHAGRREATPAEAARGAEFVFVCVGNDDDVRSVMYGDEGVLAGMAKGSVLVDHTTASAELAREIGERSADQG